MAALSDSGGSDLGPRVSGADDEIGVTEAVENSLQLLGTTSKSQGRICCGS